MSKSELPDALDHSHHLSALSKARLPSPLKGLYKYFLDPSMISLAGGIPSPAIFPFDSISAEGYLPTAYRTDQETHEETTEGSFTWLWRLLGASSKTPTKTMTIPKYAEPKTPTSIDLATALQYGRATGLNGLANFIHDFVEKVYQPGYADWATILNAGSTDAWGKIAEMLLEPGDGILVEAYTYPSAISTAWPHGFRPVPCPMDGGGMTASGMEEILANWNPQEHNGMRRPKLLYTVPVCQNPTGATMTAERKRAIYEICCKYDVIIAEDDPYFFLQAGEYVLPHKRETSQVTKEESDKHFIDSLVPSYLKFDREGRVFRIDTFSKTICPGSRLGFCTACPLFIAKLQEAHETSTQGASGFAQALVGKLLADEWKMPGYLRWLKGLKSQYRARRNDFIDLFLAQEGAALDSRQTDTGVIEFRAASKRSAFSEKWSSRYSMSDEKEKPVLFSFVPAQGGMFLWLRIHLSNHPHYPNKSSSWLIMSLWEKLAEAKVLVAPGTMFDATTVGKPPEETLLLAENGDGYFRMSFSSATYEQMQAGVDTIGKEIRAFFDV